MTSQGVDGTVDKAGRILPDSNQRVKFKGQPTNAFFATINQMFGGSSKLPTTVERGN